MLSLVMLILIYIFSVVIHEISHGLAAYYFGDPTAERQGRLSLNPLRHIDFFWTILFPALLFISSGGRFMIGMAKPVPVNFSRLRDPKRNMVWVAFAGPAANFLMAGALNFFYQLSGHLYLLYAIYFNLGLGVFNLMPIPPLDGSRIVAGCLPLPLAVKYLNLERFGFLIILVLYMTRVLWRVILPILDLFCLIFNIPRIGVQF
jgi:Zn-dependent protease